MREFERNAGGGAPVRSPAGKDWTFDADGRIIGFMSPDGSTTYAYDANGQLTAVDNSTLADESYSYDGNGKRAAVRHG